MQHARTSCKPVESTLCLLVGLKRVKDLASALDIAFDGHSQHATCEMCPDGISDWRFTKQRSNLRDGQQQNQANARGRLQSQMNEILDSQRLKERCMNIQRLLERLQRLHSVHHLLFHVRCSCGSQKAHTHTHTCNPYKHELAIFNISGLCPQWDEALY